MLLLPANVTMHGARDARAMLAQALKREPEGPIVIDASALQQFDTAVIALLLECERLAQAWGKAFTVRHAPSKLTALARLYGVDSLLRFEGAVPPSAAAAAH